MNEDDFAAAEAPRKHCKTTAFNNGATNHSIEDNQKFVVSTDFSD
jgi:hypothetical protein